MSDKEESDCYICGSSVNDMKMAIYCDYNRHVMCETCSENYLKIVMSEPTIQIPLKCMDCCEPLIYESVESFLKNTKATIDKDKFLNLMTRHALLNSKETNNEVLVECPFCCYFEIRDANNVNFIFCKNQECNKISCFYCHLECKIDNCDFLIDDDNEAEIMKHFECAFYGNLKKEIDKAIDNGLKVECPSCNTDGRKDEDSCTHMKCLNCKQIYCYFCGLAGDQCDKSDNNEDDDLGSHNNLWEHSEYRCPMYFLDVHIVDKRWPFMLESDALDFFHMKRVIKNLKHVIERNGVDFISEAEKKYNWLEKVNLTVEQILNEDTTLIKRNPQQEPLVAE